MSKKRCFEKYCSNNQICQFSAFQGKPWRRYLENLTFDDKFINKRVRLFIHQRMCREEKIIRRHNKVAKQLLNRAICKPRHWNLSIQIGIGIGIGTDTTNAIISSFIRPMDTKPSRVVIQDERTPPTKSRDPSILWSRDK